MSIKTDDFLTNCCSSSLRKSKPLINFADYSNDIENSFPIFNVFSDNSSDDDKFTVDDLDEFGLPSNYFC